MYLNLQIFQAFIIACWSFSLSDVQKSTYIYKHKYIWWGVVRKERDSLLFLHRNFTSSLVQQIIWPHIVWTIISLTLCTVPQANLISLPCFVITWSTALSEAASNLNGNMCVPNPVLKWKCQDVCSRFNYFCFHEDPLFEQCVKRN